MRGRFFTAVVATTFVLACGQDGQRDTAAAADRGAPTVGAADNTAATDVFVTAAALDGRQLVFVGQDSGIRPAAYAGAPFVPMAAFSVERDGIPNEFPPPDSMAALLERAGVGGQRVVIVGEPIPAGRAYAGLDYLGLGDRAALLDGGPGALASASGAPAADTTAGSAAPAGQVVREDMIVDAAWVHERLDDSDVVILDARPPAEFTGATPGQGIDRPGHIPGAHNLFWQTLIRSPEDPRLKDEAELRRIFAAAGVGPESTVVSYCRTGGQASFLYAVARHLGYDVRLYDGSFVDWSRTDYAVER
ncbi:MAG: rhodanese-like domain-containing protein [Gemmatimonadota bacterium]